MLSIQKLAPGSEGYYLAPIANGRDPGATLVEADGLWWGRGSAALGLHGVVRSGDLHATMAGRHPERRERLVGSNVRLAGFDCTFSTPKSVSVLHALGAGPVVAEIQAAHEAAVRGAFGYLEREACRVRAVGPEPEGLVASGWLHRTSRALDPHLHTHVLIANLVPAGDGSWHPLDATALYGELRTAGALYEAHLRHELSHRLGIEWGPLRGTWADVAAISREVVREFSQRAVEIETAMSEEGLIGPAAARLVAANTRPPKDVGVPYHALVESWRERSWGLGLSAGRLAALTPGPIELEHRIGGGWEEASGGGGWQDATLRSAVERSPDGSFTRRQLLQARCRAAPAGLDVARAEREVDQLISLEGRVVRRPGMGVRPSGPWSVRHEPCFTVPESLELEARVGALVASHAPRVTVVAYEASERVAALDSVAAAGTEWSRSGSVAVVGLVPGPRATAAFEAATGIEAAVVRPGLAASEGVHRAAAPSPQVLVVADAHRLAPAQLERLVAEACERDGDLALLVPRSAVDCYPALGAIASAAAGRLPAPRQELERAEAPVAHYSFAGADVAIVSSPDQARRHAVERACALASSGRPVVLLAGDEAVVRSLQETLALSAAAGADAVLVTHTRRLDSVIAHGRERGGERALVNGGPGAERGSERGPERGERQGEGGPERPAERSTERPVVVCLGGAGVLQRGSARLAELDRVHVVVGPPGLAPLDRASVSLPMQMPMQIAMAMSGRASGRLGMGLAAEAARPRHLTAELGAVPSGPTERAAWREAAGGIEELRNRWDLGESRSAYGTRRAAEPPELTAERERTRAAVAELGFGRSAGRDRARTMERSLVRGLER